MAGKSKPDAACPQCEAPLILDRASASANKPVAGVRTLQGEVDCGKCKTRSEFALSEKVLSGEVIGVEVRPLGVGHRWAAERNAAADAATADALADPKNVAAAEKVGSTASKVLAGAGVAEEEAQAEGQRVQARVLTLISRAAGAAAALEVGAEQHEELAEESDELEA